MCLLGIKGRALTKSSQYSFNYQAITPVLHDTMTCSTYIDQYFSLIIINSNMYFKEHKNIFTYTSKIIFLVGSCYYDIKIILIY